MKAIRKEEQLQLKELMRRAKEVVAVGPLTGYYSIKSMRFWPHAISLIAVLSSGSKCLSFRYEPEGDAVRS